MVFREGSSYKRNERGLMRKKIKLFLVLMFSALLSTMCRFYDAGERVTPISGLSCQAYTDYFGKGSVISSGLECYYTCQQAVAGPLDFKTDPSLSFSKEDLDRTLCSVAAPQSTPTGPVAAESPTLAAPATAQASPTSAIPPTALAPLLTGGITMCDGALKLISFRIVQPPPDLTDKTLTVQIAGLESSCAVNPVNTSLLTCSIPRSMTFPAQVVVNLDGALVNEFALDGVGCINIDPPTPTP
jgi:hypothetical protein